MRFPEFLRASVLLFAGAATALAVVAVAGADADGERGVVFLAMGWWTLTAALGLWFGRRPAAFRGLRRLMASARTSPALPELEPGSLLFNRLWPLAVVTVGAGALAFLFPQVPAIAAGYALLVAFAWRKQAAAVTAVEERDGVRFYIERTSPFRAPRLLRTPGLRRFEVSAERQRMEARVSRTARPPRSAVRR